MEWEYFYRNIQCYVDPLLRRILRINARRTLNTAPNSLRARERIRIRFSCTYILYMQATCNVSPSNIKHSFLQIHNALKSQMNVICKRTIKSCENIKYER